jgi:hypothetical protein
MTKHVIDLKLLCYHDKAGEWQAPLYWRNIVAHIQKLRFDPDLDPIISTRQLINQEIKEHNVVYGNSLLIFETEEDATAFKLKWS